jgi:hypothetical protein
MSMSTTWKMLHPQMTMAHLGFLPGFLSEHDPRPAREQYDTAYRHGGGWSPNNVVFTMGANRELISKYPEDPPLPPLAETTLRSETIIYYDYSWVAIVQPDGSFEVSRMD